MGKNRTVAVTSLMICLLSSEDLEALFVVEKDW